MILYIGNPKGSVKLLESINKFSDISGYKKINIQKSVAFLHTKNKLCKKKLSDNFIYNSTKMNRYQSISSFLTAIDNGPFVVMTSEKPLQHRLI